MCVSMFVRHHLEYDQYICSWASQTHITNNHTYSESLWWKLFKNHKRTQIQRQRQRQRQRHRQSAWKTQHMLYFWNPDDLLIPNMMIDTSPWSSCSRRSPWLPCSSHKISFTGPSVSPFWDFSMCVWIGTIWFYVCFLGLFVLCVFLSVCIFVLCCFVHFDWVFDSLCVCILVLLCLLGCLYFLFLLFCFFVSYCFACFDRVFVFFV